MGRLPQGQNSNSDQARLGHLPDLSLPIHTRTRGGSKKSYPGSLLQGLLQGAKGWGGQVQHTGHSLSLRLEATIKEANGRHCEPQGWTTATGKLPVCLAHCKSRNRFETSSFLGAMTILSIRSWG